MQKYEEFYYWFTFGERFRYVFNHLFYFKRDMKDKNIITALATALIASFGFISYQHFFTFKTLQEEKKEIKRSSDSVILVITERPTYSSSVETKNEIKTKKGGEVYLGQENKANQEIILKHEDKDSKKKK